MRTSIFILCALLPGLLFAEGPQPKLVTGLVVTEYPRHSAQTDKNHLNLALDQLGEPIGETYVVESLNGWKWEGERNAVARGFLTIDADGDYAFSTKSFYDRNLLMIDDKVVCDYGDGDGRVVTVPLKKGLVKILSAGFVESRGSSEGIQVRWKPPGQLELSEIPPSHLRHHDDGKSKLRKAVEPLELLPIATRSPNLRAIWLTTVTKDFIVDVYKNGVRIKDTNRRLLLDRFGASVERIQVEVRTGDWLVFHVVSNRVRHEGSKYFAVTGCLAANEFGFVSDPGSEDWSVCDDASRASEFIRHRDAGVEARAMPIARLWEEGDGFMTEYAGANFRGKALWGAASSTWIKYVASASAMPTPLKADIPNEHKPGIVPPPVVPGPVPVLDLKAAPPSLPLLAVKHWPVQILSAVYGTGGKDADVTAKVKEFVEVKRSFFAVTPTHLGADPNPYWNKSLHIVYTKDGVRREQRRNENEHVLPESFYGPQDAGELTAWLPGTRWLGPKGEIQFHSNRTLTGAGFKGTANWEALANNKLRIIWAEDQKVEFNFDTIWTSFSVPQDGKDAYHLVK